MWTCQWGGASVPQPLKPVAMHVTVWVVQKAIGFKMTIYYYLLKGYDVQLSDTGKEVDNYLK